MMQVLEKILQETEKEKLNIDKFRGATLKALAKQWNNAIDTVAEIIRSHMEEDKWIPVGERLPEVPEGTEDAYCPEFNVTIKGFSGSTTLKYSWDGTWFDDSGNLYNVVAWQPLPEPYQPDKCTGCFGAAGNDCKGCNR